MDGESRVMSAEQARDRLIYEQAAQWHSRMQRDPDLKEREAFDKWLMESQRHMRSYLLVTALDHEMGRIDPERQLSVGEPACGASAESVVALRQRFSARNASMSPVPRRAASRWAVAAGIAALFAATIAWWAQPHGERYATAIGEQRIVKLDDGSVMYLNTNTSALVRYSRTGRDIELTSGEASFNVAREASRPFVVAAGSTTVRAIGTEFNVYRRDGETAVAVVEGRVQVTTSERPLPLGAGEEASVESSGNVTKRKATNTSAVVAWRERRLVFRESALDDIAYEFNRYNTAPRLRIEGTGAGTRRYSGIFDAYDPSSLAQVLSEDHDLSVERNADEIVVRARTR